MSTDRKRRRATPALEQVESRALLSAAPVSTPPEAVPIDASMITASLAQTTQLTGQITGRLSPKPSIPDVGKAFAASGNGRVSHFGRVQASGAFHATGFIGEGQATGTITIANRHGTATIELTGPKQRGFSDLPSTFTYRVTKATGQLATFLNSFGTADLTRGAATPRGGSTFSLSLHSSPVTTL